MSPLKEIQVFISELRERNALVLDTETTGLGPEDEVIQIAICTLEGDRLLYSNVRPRKARTWPEAEKIHGISWDDVKDAPTMEDLRGFLIDYLCDRTAAIYNVRYDTRMIDQSVDMVNSDWNWLVNVNWFCVMEAYARYWGDWSSWHQSYKWQSLEVACRQQDVEVADAHDALADARMTAALLRALERRVG